MKGIFLLCAIALVSLGGIECNSETKTCVGCKKLAYFLSNITHNEENKEGLIKLCDEYSLLPGKQSVAWCTKAVNRFYQLVNSNLKTDTVCYDIKACNKPYLHRVILTDMKEEFDNKNDCDFCLFVSGKIKDIIVGGPTELEIKTHIEDTCHIFKSIEQECVQIFNEYFDTIFTYLNQTFQPRDLCRSLRLCPAGHRVRLNEITAAQSLKRWNTLDEPAANPAVQKFNPVENSNPVNCAICKKLVKIIQTQLKDNATDQQILNVLDAVCEIFPRSDRSNCRSVVTDYTTKLIQALTQDIDPDIACALVGLCVPSRFINYLNGYYIKHSMPKNVACEECELIAHYIQNQMYNFKNEEQVESFMKNVLCKQLSYFIKEKDCDIFVNDYTPLVMQLIAQELFDPTTLCYKEVKVCKNKTTTAVKVRKETNCELCKQLIKKMTSVPTTVLVSIDQLTETVCKFMPKPAKIECGLMMKAFGPYFAESVDRYETANEICRSIDLCVVTGHVHLLGGHKCTYGPSYWCHSEDHANACNASSYCHEKVWASTA